MTRSTTPEPSRWCDDHDTHHRVANLVTDLGGDHHEVEPALHADWGRVVYYDLDAYSPKQARDLARRLIAAADALTDSLVLLSGGSQ